MNDGTATPIRRRKRTTYVDDRTWEIFGAFKAGIVGRRGEAMVAAALVETGITALNDVILPGEKDLTQIDHLALTRGGIVVIETKTYAGRIVGDAEGALWMQHLAEGEVRHSFMNPLHQNRMHMDAVRQVLAALDVGIVGMVVSAGSATFDAGLAEHIVPLAELARAIGQTERRPSHPPAVLNAAWRELERCAAEGEGLRGEHIEAMRRRRAIGE